MFNKTIQSTLVLISNIVACKFGIKIKFFDQFDHVFDKKLILYL